VDQVPSLRVANLPGRVDPEGARDPEGLEDGDEVAVAVAFLERDGVAGGESAQEIGRAIGQDGIDDVLSPGEGHCRG
jgi:hypothetical protein